MYEKAVQRLIVVIDALDECDREEGIRTILTLLAWAEDIRPVSLRIVLTNRPELPIRSRLQRHGRRRLSGPYIA
jgi:hypothetical protein